MMAVRSFLGTEMINGGRTAVVRFEGADGQELVLLIPERVT